MLEQKPWEMNWEGVQSDAAPAIQTRRGGSVSLDAPASAPQGKDGQAAFSKVSGLRTFGKSIHRIRDMYDRNFSGSGVAGGLNEYNPFRLENQEFDGAVASLPLLMRQAFRIVGSGPDTNAELRPILDSLPSRWSFDETNRGRFNTLDALLPDMIANYGHQAGYSPEQIAALKAEMIYKGPPKRGLPKPPPSGARRVRPSRVVVDISGKRVK